MAQFDICQVRGGGLVLDCQSDLLSSLKTRRVVPLRHEGDEAPKPIRGLMPVFDVAGEPHVMVTPLARAIAVRDIDATIGSLVSREYEIKAALDLLISGI